MQNKNKNKIETDTDTDTHTVHKTEIGAETETETAAFCSTKKVHVTSTTGFNSRLQGTVLRTVWCITSTQPVNLSYTL